MSRVLIIGGGAAGMFAAVMAAQFGHEVHIFEQNEKLGKKLFITGKGRCNFTNACSMEELRSQVVTNPKFLYSAFSAYTNEDIIDFFEQAGMPTKVERGGRAFPASDHSSDVIRTLERAMKDAGVKIHLGSCVKGILQTDEAVTGVTLANGAEIAGDAVLVATGGLSYPVTGSTGDGYRFAKEAGHSIEEPGPSLVPFETKEDYIPKMQGLSLKNVTLTLSQNGKNVYEAFGEMLFTHFGISGPLVLTASAKVGALLKKGFLNGSIDLKPALSVEQLDQRILRDFEENKNRQFKNSISGLLPSKMLPVLLELSEIAPEKKVNEISREERRQLVELIKGFPLTVVGTRQFNEAIITRGGVSIREIKPKTMESKKCKGLYFIGEVLDVDALTGGFNLQIAWSTAYAAASAIPY